MIKMEGSPGKELGRGTFDGSRAMEPGLPVVSVTRLPVSVVNAVDPPIDIETSPPDTVSVFNFSRRVATMIPGPV